MLVLCKIKFLSCKNMEFHKKDFIVCKQLVQKIKTGSKEYRLRLATAKYLFNDTTFPAWFIKREGQVYLNTWHGTPFKMMGRDVWNRAYAIGKNIPRNILSTL